MKLIRSKFKKVTLLALAGLGLSMTAAHAVVTYTQGDLLMGFFRPGDASTYVVNVGSATQFRDWNNAANLNLSLGNIANDLIALYGATWYEDTTLTWGLGGSPSNTTAVNNDPSRTLYATRDPGSLTTGFDTPGSAAWGTPTAIVSGVRTSASTAMQGLQNGFDIDTETANSAFATIQGTSDANNYTSYNPLGIAFGAFNSNITSAFTAGSLGSGVESALDLWRVLNTATDPSGEGGAVGVGKFQGTFYINQGGQISFGAQAIPEPSRMLLSAFGLGFLALRRRRPSAKK